MGAYEILGHISGPRSALIQHLNVKLENNAEVVCFLEMNDATFVCLNMWKLRKLRIRTDEKIYIRVKHRMNYAMHMRCALFLANWFQAV